MHVLIVGECPSITSSAGKLVNNMVVGFARKNISTTVMCAGADTSLYMWGTRYNPRNNCEGKICSEIPDVTVDVRPMLSLQYELQRKQYETGKNYDIVLVYGYAHSPPISQIIQEVANDRDKIKTPVIGYIIEETLRVPPTYTTDLEKLDAIIFPTNYHRKQYEKANPELKGKTFVVPHGILEIYAYHSCDKQDNKQYTYATLSKNMIRKDAGSLIQAFMTMLSQGIDATLGLFLVDHMGGEGWDIDTIISLYALEYGLDKSLVDDRIFLLEEAYRTRGLTENEIISLYRDTGVFVFPTTGEAFGMPPVEAGMMGLPVVMTGIPVLKEIWDGYPEQVFVDCRQIVYPSGHVLCHPDPDNLMDKMLLVHDNRDVFGKLARSVAGKYTVDNMTKGFLRVFEKHL